MRLCRTAFWRRLDRYDVAHHFTASSLEGLLFWLIIEWAVMTRDASFPDVDVHNDE